MMITLRPKISITLVLSFVAMTKVFAQNPKIKCYFNHPVNNALATGVNAAYVKTSFPDTIVSYINKAKYTLDFAIFNYASVPTDSLAKIAVAVNNAYNRGVVVRWVSDGSSKNTGTSLLNPAIPVINSPTSSSYGLMHNKFIVIDVNSKNPDDAYVIAGSYNFTLQQTATDYNNIIIIQNQSLASAYYDQFNQMWGGKTNLPDTTKSLFGPKKLTSTKHYFNVNGTLVQVHFSPKDTCGKYLTNVINSANNDLTFGIYAFTDATMASAILNKFNRKVIVRGIADGFSKTYAPYDSLSGPLGSNFVLYTGSGLYHSKVMIADALLASSDPQVATGSFNWSSSAAKSNDENLLIIHDSIIANQYYQALCNDITVNGGNACIAPLPVNWLSFDAVLRGSNSVALHWLVSGELNVNYFEVERSKDGINYEKVGIVKEAAGGAYTFMDLSPSTGTNYYRIKEVDEDGVAAYSKVLNVYNRTNQALGIYPNPAINKMSVRLPLGANRITICNAVGTRIAQFDARMQSSINIDVSNFPNGKYYLEVISDANKMVASFEKL